MIRASERDSGGVDAQVVDPRRANSWKGVKYAGHESTRFSQPTAYCLGPDSVVVSCRQEGFGIPMAE